MNPDKVPLPEDSDIDPEILLVRLQSLIDAQPDLFLNDPHLAGDIEYVLQNSPEGFLQTFQKPTEEILLLQAVRGHTFAVIKHVRQVLKEGLIPDMVLTKEVENRIVRLEMYLAVTNK